MTKENILRKAFIPRVCSEEYFNHCLEIKGEWASSVSAALEAMDEYKNTSPVEDEWVSELPNDDECAEWYDLNIGNDPEKPCSASSAIYKFRGWLNERNKHSSYQRILDAATRLLKWYDDESENNPHSTEEWSNAYEELRAALPQPPSQTNKPE